MYRFPLGIAPKEQYKIPFYVWVSTIQNNLSLIKHSLKTMYSHL